MESLEIALRMAKAAQVAWAKVRDDPHRHDKLGVGAGGNLTSRADHVLEKAILDEAARAGASVLSE